MNERYMLKSMKDIQFIKKSSIYFYSFINSHKAVINWHLGSFNLKWRYNYVRKLLIIKLKFTHAKGKAILLKAFNKKDQHVSYNKTGDIIKINTDK